MDPNGRVQVSASRSIAAPAARIFQVLADPANHPALDGSGMLRVAPGQPPPQPGWRHVRDGDAPPDLGDYLMLNRITVFEQDRRIAWEPTPGDAVAWPNAELPVGASRGTAGASNSSLTMTRQSSPSCSTAPKPLRESAMPWGREELGSRHAPDT